MKKFYTFVCAAAAMVAFSTQSASAEKVLDGEYNATPQVSLSNSIKQAAAIVSPAAATLNRADEEGEWVKVSTGIWFEGPLAATYSDVDAAQWDVDIYQNEAQPGVIRLNPYGADAPTSQLIGRANTYELEINIANPEKCYFLDWMPYGMMIVGGYCTENQWNASNYGTLVDGTVTFPTGTVVRSMDGKSWSLLGGEMKLVLDKSAFVDYSLNVTGPFCAPANESYINITKGDGIAKVMVEFLPGEYEMSDNNAKIVASSGSDATSYCGKLLSYGATGPNNLYTVLYVGLDADGNIKAQGAFYQYVIEDDAANWKALGEATYTESLLSSFFTDVDAEDLTCVIEENVNTPGYYRLVNPYAGTQFDSKEGHNHYLYIDATDPAKVIVEPSVLGAYINSNFGYAAAQSWGYYLGGNSMAETYAVYGKMENGVITVPAFLLQLSNYRDSEYLNITNLPATGDNANPFKVVLPAPAAPAHDIEGVDENGSVELKDGQEITLTAGEGEDIYFAWEEVKAEEDPQALASQKRMPADEDFVILPAEANGKVTFEAENDGDQKYLHYYAQNAATGAKSPVTSLLITRNGSTGVESINAAASEAAVEYFNLQGIRIDSPVEGQVVIRRQGSTITKVVK